MRWRLKLAEYEYEIIHKSGKTNLNADALSRNPVTTAFPIAKKRRTKEDSDYHEEISDLALDESCIGKRVKTRRRKQIIYPTSSVSDESPEDEADNIDAQSPIPSTSAPGRRSVLPTLSFEKVREDKDTEDEGVLPTFGPSELSVRDDDTFVATSDSESGDLSDSFATFMEMTQRQIDLLNSMNDSIEQDKQIQQMAARRESWETQDLPTRIPSPSEPESESPTSTNENDSVIHTASPPGRATNQRSSYLPTPRPSLVPNYQSTPSEEPHQTRSPRIPEPTSKDWNPSNEEHNPGPSTRNNQNVDRNTRSEPTPLAQPSVIDDDSESDHQHMYHTAKNSVETPPPALRNDIIREYHAGLVGGHKGVTKTYHRIRQQFHWPHMLEDIQQFIRTCDSCQRQKLVRIKTRQPMIITDTPADAFDKVALDTVGPLNLTPSGNRYILTMQDNLTKYCIAVPIPNIRATTIADAFARHFIAVFGTPRAILTDRGSSFIGRLMTKLAEIFKIKTITTSGYRPQTNGSLERSHLVLTEYLKHYMKTYDDWGLLIPFAMFSYNTSMHEATQFTPHELIFGKPARIPTSYPPARNLATYGTYIAELATRLNEIRKLTRTNLHQAKIRSKQYYDRTVHPENFKIGDFVYAPYANLELTSSTHIM